MEIRRKLIVFEERDSILHLVQDVTEITEIENLKAENKFSTILISAVIHELRTPTTAIQNSMHILKSELTSEHQLKLVTNIFNQLWYNYKL